MIAGFGRLGGSDFAVGVKGPVAAGRTETDRARIGVSEQLEGRIRLADVDQPARAQHELLEAFAIGAQRLLVVDAGRM
jgi:hypothetical protein